MAREISPICNFIFGSIWTGLPIDTVDVELTFLPNPNPNEDIPQERPELDGLTGGIGSTP